MKCLYETAGLIWASSADVKLSSEEMRFTYFIIRYYNIFNQLSMFYESKNKGYLPGSMPGREQLKR